MKKALLLVVVFVLVFAFAAPAFADGPVTYTGTAPVSVTVEHALSVMWNSSGINLGEIAPNATGTGSFVAGISSNDSFKGSFALTGDATILKSTAKLNNAPYAWGTQFAGAMGSASEKLDVSLTPNMTDAAGAHSGSVPGRRAECEGCVGLAHSATATRAPVPAAIQPAVPVSAMSIVARNHEQNGCERAAAGGIRLS